MTSRNFGLPSIIWSRIVAQEKELNKDPTSFQFLNMCYDLTGNFLIYPSPLGIRVYNLVTDKVVREIGKGENIRFLSATLWFVFCCAC
jgi:peptidylprolyl isomerase domain and WD repeat-containing protein 1